MGLLLGIGVALLTGHASSATEWAVCSGLVGLVIAMLLPHGSLKP